MGYESSVKRDWHKLIKYAGLFVLAFALAATFLDAEKTRDVGRSVYQRWQEFVWDKWKEGQIRWDNYVLSVPVGEYGWIVHSDGDLSLFARNSRGIVSIVAKKAERSRWPYQRHVELTCVEKKLCSRLDRSSVVIDDRKADVVVFEDTSPGLTVRSNAYIYLTDPEILISIGTQMDDDLPMAVAFGENLLGQIVRQAKAH